MLDEIMEIPYLNHVLWFRSLVMAIFFGAFVLIILYSLQNDKRIITHLAFDDDANVLSVGSESIGSSNLIMVPYHDLTFEDDGCYEPIKGKICKAIAVKQKETVVGYILRDHYIWSSEDIMQIELSIQKLKNL